MIVFDIGIAAARRFHAVNGRKGAQSKAGGGRAMLQRFRFGSVAPRQPDKRQSGSCFWRGVRQLGCDGGVDEVGTAVEVDQRLASRCWVEFRAGAVSRLARWAR